MYLTDSVLKMRTKAKKAQVSFMVTLIIFDVLPQTHITFSGSYKRKAVITGEHDVCERTQKH